MGTGQLEFRLLGPLEVLADGEQLAMGGPKQRSLLALLLLSANRPVARNQLIDALWGDEPPESAAKIVQVYVSQLRKLLPEGTIVTRSRGYAIEVEREAIDLNRFERLVARARSAEPAQAARLLREAVALWRGPALAELTDEPFARTEGRRLAELRLAALEERLDADLAAGGDTQLVPELEGLIAEHPHRERFRAQLMLALYRSGRQADALAAYRDARAALGELGLEPGPALRQLEKRILVQDPALDGPSRATAESVPMPGPLIPTPGFPFVGRAAELTALRAALTRAERGEGGFVLLGGEAGAGKTRLARELALDASARGVLVCYGASDAAVSTPYQPLREWLGFLARVEDPASLREGLHGHAEQLTRLVPELAEHAEPQGAAGEAAADRYLQQRAVTELLRRLSRKRPLLLVADDLQWADGDTLHLLGQLARFAPEARTLVVGAFRDRGEELGRELGAMLADLARLDGVTRLSLGRLSSDEVRAFIRTSSRAEPTAELALALDELTEGTPLLLCELWRDLRERDAVELTAEGLRLSQPVEELRGPDRIRDVVRHRVVRLGPETRATIELAAVAGPVFELRVLAEASGVDEAALAARVEEAGRNGILDELPQPERTCRFTHELLRRAIYDGIAGRRRSELHLRVGEALERAHASDLARVLPELAHHFTLAAPAGGAERALDYNLRAAESAIAAAAYSVAAARLAAALELGIADPQERARVQLELAYLLRETDRPAASQTLLAASLAAETGAEERAAAARSLLDRVGPRLWNPTVDPGEVRAIVVDALRTFTELGDERGMAEAEGYLGVADLREGRLAATLAAMERALVHAEASGSQVTRRRAVGSVTHALWDGPTPVEEAIRRCEELRRAGADDLMLDGVVTRVLAALLAMAGRPDEALEHLRHSCLVLDELDVISSWVHRHVAANVRELIGDLAGAEEEEARVLEQVGAKLRDRQGDAPDVRVMQSAYRLALIRCDLGRWDEAERCLEYGSEVPMPDSHRPEAVLGLAGRARVAAHNGDLAQGLKLARRGIELAELSDRPNLRGRAWRALAEVQRRRGADAEADDAVAAALRLYEAKGNVAAAAALRAAAHEVAG